MKKMTPSCRPPANSSHQADCCCFFTAKGGPPEFIEPLVGMELSEGSEARLECQVGGTPPPKIEWYKGNDIVEEGDEIKVQLADDLCALVIPNVNNVHQGVYRCVATNDYGSTTTTADLLVTAPDSPPVFKKELQDVAVSIGNDIRLEVGIRGKPEPTVEWFKNDELIEDQGRNVIVDKDDESEQYMLAVEDVTRGDSGSYKCVAKNALGEATCVCQVVVGEEEMAPVFIEEAQDGSVTVLDGGNVRLEARIGGAPAPRVEWFKDEEPVVAGEHFVKMADGDRHCLDIVHVSPQDSGTYKCVGTNNLGTITRIYSLDIEGTVLCLG